MTSTLVNWLLNSGLFYLGWILTIKYVLEGEGWKGILFILCILAWHLWHSSERLLEALLILSFCLFGPLLDTTLAFCGILTYRENYECYPWLAPPWIQALWALFGTSINHSLDWAGRSWILAALLGAVGGTSSYLAVIKVGGASFAIAPFWGTLCLITAWSIVFPLCFSYNRWLKSCLK